MTIKTTTIANVIRSISISLFIVALTQPCCDTESGPGDAGQAAALFLSGFFGFFSSATGLIWLANPVLFFSGFFIIKKPQISLSLNIGAVFIALLFQACNTIMINEGGATSPIIGYRSGYWLWLASISAMLVGNIFLNLKNDYPAKQIVVKPRSPIGIRTR